ncbi:MAG: hypothetical protein ACOCUS_01125 [Polyangiales bacterium]
MGKHFDAPQQTTPERRALFELVEREVDAFLAWEPGAKLPPPVVGIAVLSLHELGVMDDAAITDWSTLRYDLVLDRFPLVSLVHPWAAGCYLDAWVAWAHWLHVQGRVDARTRERLLDEIARGADRFLREVEARFRLLAPTWLGDEADRVLGLEGPRLLS